jgi:hypothetical protein
MLNRGGLTKPSQAKFHKLGLAIVDTVYPIKSMLGHLVCKYKI